MLKSTLLFILLFCCLLFVPAQESSVGFTFDDCLRYAFSNNKDLKSIQLSTESQQITYDQSKLQRLPNLGASLGESFSNRSASSGFSGNASLSSAVTIYQGGNLNRTIESNKLSLDRSSYQVSQYNNELVINILQAFITVLGNEELLKYQETVLQTSQAQWKQGVVKYDAGAILESDLLLLEAQYYSDSNNVVDTKINRDNNLLALKVLLSMDPLEPLRIIGPAEASFDGMAATLPTLEETMQQALDFLPDLKISLTDIDLAKKNLDIVQSNYYPTISANASVGTGHNDFAEFTNQVSDGLNEQIGISMSIPIYSRGSVKSNVKKQSIAVEQAQLDYEQNLLSLRQTIAQQYQNVVSADNAYRVSDIKQNAYRKSFDAFELQFEHGSITTVELLQQQNNYINAVNDYVQNKYAFVLQRKILDVYTGKTVSL